MSDESKNTISFGITTETKTSNNTPILVATKVENNPQFPNGWKFPKARLVNIIANAEFKLRDESTTSVLQFIFTDRDKRQHIHTEWAVDLSDDKLMTKKEGMETRIAHIYEAIFGSIPSTGIGAGATSFTDFFAKVKEAFNAQVVTKEEKSIPVYTQVEVYLKLTYYKKNLGFPLSPNFIEKVVQNQPCKTLTINTAYDTLEPPKAGGASGIPGVSGGGSIPTGDDLPSFDGSFS